MLESEGRSLITWEENNTYFPSYVIIGGRLCWVLRLSLTPCVLQDHPHVSTCESVCVSYRLPNYTAAISPLWDDK